MAKAKQLVVVESPAKARTISNILGRNYDVRASIGHVRDLPKAELGVDVKNDFAPRYIIPRNKRKAVKEIEEAASKASSVYLATDPDREGEAIAWHLLEALDLEKTAYKRVVFHEITPEAVRRAFESPRDIDKKLVDAQQARRILDRLLGYRLSPFLWKKVKRGLSAGRVQSVALRMLVEREREIEQFVPQEYWTIDVLLEKQGALPAFRARLAGYAQRNRKLEIASEATAQRLVDLLRQAEHQVSDFKKREQARRPSPPFITSTLQQEASRKLGFSAKRTMAVAQQLYEGVALGPQGETGLITYMRTDSLQVTPSAKEETRHYIAQRFGKEYVPRAAREYRKKVRGAQEAHEAIRPTSIQREPDAIRQYLSNDQYRLYNLIWQRMVASQMADAIYDVTSAEIEARAVGEDALLLRATNTQLRFAGYRQLYVEGRDDEEEDDEGSNPMPDLAVGDLLRLLETLPDQHFTEPPPRYTEASLVKALEDRGIGRPSTYAPILSTIQERGYAQKQGRQLRPSELGFVVNDLLVEYFPGFVDYDFTAEMEEELDDIASGKRQWQPVVKEVYDPLEQALALASEAPPAHEETGETCELCGRPMIIRWGRRGRFLSCSGFPECKNSRPLEGEEQPQPEPTDETCDECGSPMVIRSGRYGRFLACSRYPECKDTKPLLVKTGVQCPRCGGELIERRSRRGRTFYGCSNYPRCEFTSWTRPLPVACPQCNGLLTAEKDNQARCSSCQWQGPLPELVGAARD
ncbi:MAG TPA: type I DNA topoisomerase [Dehalococcoidia bacterium]|nr:type I DNA topoisomerase [Dehalococcoidia bacterium]